MNVNRLRNCPLHCDGLGLLAVIGEAEAAAVVNPAHNSPSPGPAANSAPARTAAVPRRRRRFGDNGRGSRPAEAQ